MNYPGHIIKVGESDRSIVKAVQKQLEAAGCGPIDTLGVFGSQTKASVKLFQARHADTRSIPLKQDGEVGPLTWSALFGSDTLSSSNGASSQLLKDVIVTAGSQVGVREQPKDSNSGPQVDAYLQRVGVSLNLPATEKPWCCAFVYWCFDESAHAESRPNPMMRTAGCLEHWNGAVAHGARRILASRAANDPSLIAPGMIFIVDHGEGRGHTGIVESVAAGLLQTIEGNTDASHTREGGGVYRLSRKFAEINRGFIDYGSS